MQRLAYLATGGALCLILLTSAASAQQTQDSYPRFSLGGNVGFQTLGGGTGLFELGFDAPIRFTEHFSIGPWMQIGVGKSTVNLLVTANSRWHFDFLERTMFNKVQPFVQGGLGLAYTQVNGAGATDFVINMGFGAEVPVSDHLYLGSDIMFNPILTRAGGGWTFSWQFATLRYRF